MSDRERRSDIIRQNHLQRQRERHFRSRIRDIEERIKDDELKSLTRKLKKRSRRFIRKGINEATTSYDTTSKVLRRKKRNPNWNFKGSVRNTQASDFVSGESFSDMIKAESYHPEQSLSEKIKRSYSGNTNNSIANRVSREVSSIKTRRNMRDFY